MANRQYDIETVLSSLRRIGLKFTPPILTIPAKIDIGIKNWGKIDFLKGKGVVALVVKEK
jgi:hypothetical protein